MSPENMWLEDDPFLLKRALKRGDARPFSEVCSCRNGGEIIPIGGVVPFNLGAFWGTKKTAYLLVSGMGNFLEHGIPGLETRPFGVPDLRPSTTSRRWAKRIQL